MKRIPAFLFILSIFGCMSCKTESKTDEQIFKEIDALIAKMTLEEKVNLLHSVSDFNSGGCERLGIAEIIMSDGPHGVRDEFVGRGEVKYGVDDYTTYLPVSIALAATFNPAMGELFGTVLGSEARGRGKDIILGPGVNINRTPLNGRNFEYMGEDPYLAGMMAATEIKAIQQQGVSACLKHYALNNQEVERGSISVELDERALHEIYLPAFKRAVMEGGVYSVMASYNKIRGVYATENSYLMNDVLKKQWGFKGAVISDWGAVHTSYEAAVGGTDIEMGTHFAQRGMAFDEYYFAKPLIQLVKEGKVSEEIVNDKVRRVLYLQYKVMKQKDRPKGSRSTEEHHNASLTIAREAIVLLKNEQQILPLDTSDDKTFALIGSNAINQHAIRGGSSKVKPYYEITPYDGFFNIMGNDCKAKFALGYTHDKREHPDTLIKKAVKIASESNYAIIYGGLIHGYSDRFNDGAYDAEAVDRPDMKLPFGQDKLIEAVAAVNPNTIVVLVGGGPVEMPWINKVKGVVQAWYPGMLGGIAITEILTGKVNPSGKLPVTFPVKLEDSPAHAMGEYPGKAGVVKYNEGLFVGYRYYDSKQVNPLFPFGHGLSYTSFLISNAKLSKGQMTVKENVNVSCTIANTGKHDGAEVIQVYVKPINPKVIRPEKELKAFKKVLLKKGEKQTVSIELTPEAFQYYNPDKKQWQTDAGKYQVLIGTSSRDIKATMEVIIN